MRTLLAGALCLCASVGLAGIVDDDAIFRRGDVNHSGTVNISDSSYLTNFLFKGGLAPPCMNEADVNHDGSVNASDNAFLLNWLFNGGATPPAPGPYNNVCTHSTAPIISCVSGC